MAARRYSMQARQRLGELLLERRPELDPGFENRAVFADARGIGYKLSQYIENPPPNRGSSQVTLRDVVAPAYGVTFSSVLDVLNEVPGADLEAAPGESPRRVRGRHRAPAIGGSRQAAAIDAELANITAGLAPLISPDREAQARPYADKISEARTRLKIQYAAAHPGVAADDVPEPPGSELVRELERLYAPGPPPPGLDLDADEWDRNADVLSVTERIWLLAELQGRRVARERQAGTG